MPEMESWQFLRNALWERLGRFQSGDGRDLAVVEDEEHRSLRLDGRPLLLLGAGSRIAQPFVRHAMACHDVVGVVDNHRAGERFDSLDVVPDTAVPDMMDAHPDLLAVICAFGVAQHHFMSLAERSAIPYLTLPQALRRAGLLTADEPSDWLRNAHPGVTLQVATRVEAAGHLQDPRSLATFYAVLLHRLTWNPHWLDGVRRPPSELCAGSDTLALGTEETIVDAGAYDGDTAEHFRRITNGRYRAMHCFEPDPRNHEALCRRVAGWAGVEIHRSGLWSTSGRLAFAGDGGQGSHISDTGSFDIDVTALDDIPNLMPTLVKMDIEGAETEALTGMRRILKSFKPKLALSAYHKPEDLHVLPDMIASIRDDYRFRLRHYGAGLFDTVLYAS